MDFSLKETMLYIVTFAAVYVQVFFLLVFFENKKYFGKKGKDALPTPKERVTFMIPCWNEASTIDSTVQSIKNLAYPKEKVFIFLINDGSTDNTLEVIKKYENDPQIRIFNKENGGKHTALNLGLSLVETELVCSIDADTTLHKNVLLHTVPYFSKNVKVGAVGGNVLIKSPQTLVQKAQSIEYQMFSYNKKMLAFMGGAMVAPGAFSVFRTKALREIGGWRDGHNLEDLELTYRLQTSGYVVEQANKALAATSGPESLKGLFRQRLRWGYGLLNNSVDYRHVFFNKKYGNFGYFTMPVSIALYGVVLTVFFISWSRIFSFMYEKFLVFKLAGADAVFSFSFNSFYIDTKAITFLTILAFSFLLLNIFLGRVVSNVKEKKFLHFVYFILVYSFIAPLWVLKAVWNTITRSRPSWR